MSSVEQLDRESSGDSEGRRRRAARASEPLQTAAAQVEPSSWWPLVSMIFGGVGSYALLLVHLLLDAGNARPWMWTLMVVPLAFFLAAAFTFAVGSGMPVRERLAAIPAGVLGYSPRTSG
jgi:hypothetical protein